ncbi:MAG: glycosyl hydrolase family 28 protein [Tepidisphaeraceae bacterium]|jgi:polygalacturonase
MKLRYINFQRHLIGLFFATFLAGTFTSGLKAEQASIATTRPQVLVDATSQGIRGDGATLNTAAIQLAIDSLTSHGGGVLEFPAGRYVTGTIQLKDNVRLRLGPDAILLGSHNPADYRILEPFVTGDGGNLGYALVTAVDASHVGIEGSGKIDGQGKSLKAAQAKFTIRPFLIRWVRCTDVVVRDVHLTDPGAWTMHFFQCKNVVAEKLTIRSADSHLTNNDGIDIDSCQGALVSDCDIESGDDAICVKTTSPKTCGDQIITDCKLKTRCNGIKLGTESIGDFANIRVSNCKLHDIGMSGIALYAVDGAQLHDVTLTDLDMDGVTVPISIRLGARLKTFHPGDQMRPVGSLHDITIENIHATGAKQIGLLINGIPDHPVESLRLKNIDITLNGGGKITDADVQLAEKEKAYPEYNMFGKVMPAYGAYIRHARGVSSEHVKLSTTRPDARPGVDLIDAEGVNVGDFAVATPAAPTTLPDR